jgi:hypothetical protein
LGFFLVPPFGALDCSWSKSAPVGPEFGQNSDRRRRAQTRRFSVASEPRAKSARRVASQDTRRGIECDSSIPTIEVVKRRLFALRTRREPGKRPSPINHRGMDAEAYARALWSDGVRKGGSPGYRPVALSSIARTPRSTIARSRCCEMMLSPLQSTQRLRFGVSRRALPSRLRRVPHALHSGQVAKHVVHRSPPNCTIEPPTMCQNRCASKSA